MVLGFAGHSVETVEDGRDALERIESDPEAFDVLITDNNMPRLSGIELVKRLRGRNVPIKIVMASAFASQVDAISREELRLDGVLQKPFSKAELLACVKNLGHQTGYP